MKTMKRGTRKLKGKKGVFHIEENLRQFFPPVSHMGNLRPSKWIKIIGGTPSDRTKVTVKS